MRARLFAAVLAVSTGTAAAQEPAGAGDMAGGGSALSTFEPATLPLTGAYGDEAGCARAEGLASEGDTLLLLEPDGLTLPEAVCETAAVHPLRDGAFVMLGACRAEGAREVRSYTLVPDNEYLSFTLHAEDGQELGTVRPCG